MVHQARPWQDNEESADPPTPDDWIDNQLHQYVEEHLSSPEPDDGDWGFAEDVTSDDYTDDW
jgi:hypothetical protein